MSTQSRKVRETSFRVVIFSRNKKFLSEDEIADVKDIVGIDMGAATMASAVLLSVLKVFVQDGISRPAYLSRA